MDEHLFDHVDIDPGTSTPDGDPAKEVRDYCDRYEQAILEAGGIESILGIGRTGTSDSTSRVGSSVADPPHRPDKVTRTDAASDFFGEENVPARAITMGVGTILAAHRVVMLAFGEGKAGVVHEAVEGEVTATIAASFLQEHPNARVHLDLAAAAELTRCKSPWICRDIDWTEALTRKATIWLARKVGKPILKLTREDYNENHLQDLLAERGGAYDINLEVFRTLRKTITGWPGGKPASRRREGDIVRSGDDVFPKRVLIFSPHPDDDVISMGGTLLRLVDQGHEVHVAYQVSGSIAVFDAAALRFADFAADFNATFGLDGERAEAFEDRIGCFLRGKSPGEVDSPEVQTLKGLIRRGEARAAGRYCGVPDENLHFLDMPFYETGRVKKKPLAGDDIDIVADLLRRIRPQQVYAAGDLSDPHGTHRTCLDAIVRAWQRVRDDDWTAQTSIWLYRGALASGTSIVSRWRSPSHPTN